MYSKKIPFLVGWYWCFPQRGEPRVTYVTPEGQLRVYDEGSGTFTEYHEPPLGHYMPINPPEPPQVGVWKWETVRVSGFPERWRSMRMHSSGECCVFAPTRASAIAAARAMTEAEGAQFEEID